MAPVQKNMIQKTMTQANNTMIDPHNSNHRLIGFDVTDHGKRRYGQQKRQIKGGQWGRVFSVSLLMALAGCASTVDENKVERGQLGFISGFYGGVAVDEPRAALVGRNILSQGGKAADAAAAIYFALTVTMPSRASLASGGVCLTYEGRTQKSETLDFRLQQTTPVAGGAGQAVPVPAAPLAFYLLHSKYGRRLPWASLVIPAENLARFGNQVSRAFAKDVKAAKPLIDGSPALQQLLKNGAGNIVGEGDYLRQLDLSAQLATIRAKTSGDMYHGVGGRKFMEAVRLGGGKINENALRNYKPNWRDVKKVGYVLGTQFIFPDAGDVSNTGADKIINALAEPKNYAALPENARDQRFLEIQKKVMPKLRQINGEGDKSVTSFLVVDRVGNAVACNLSMNKLFGSGVVARGTGIIMGAVPDGNGDGPLMNAMMLVSIIRPTFIYASTGGGGLDSAAAMTRVALDVFADEDDKLTLETIVNKGRVFSNPSSGAVIAEQNVKSNSAAQTVPVIGRLNAMYCSTGIPNEKGEQCTVYTDPRGFGLAVSNR